MKRPRVSICLATYNGRRFVGEQILSLLPQLEPDDEIIVFDDGSSDGTPDIVRQFTDPRIRLHLRDNIGHVRNFERALYACAGEVVFLCDQDDIWHKGKIDQVCAVFQEFPDVAMVHHERELVDGEGASLGKGPRLGSGLKKGLGFLLRELGVPRIFGCCLAIRSRCLQVLLPFPPGIYAHDHWAAVIGSLDGGILFLPKALIRQRQHASNVTPKSGLPWRSRLKVRLLFVIMMFEGYRRVKRRAAASKS